MVKALSRAFRGRKIPDEGGCETIEELAKLGGVNRGYMSRVLRLTLLAPDIVEAILGGRQPEEMRLEDLLEGFPADWEGQRAQFAPIDVARVARRRGIRRFTPTPAPSHR